MNKFIYYFNIILIALSAIGGATALQITPFLLVWLLLYLKNKKENKEDINYMLIAISATMVVVNMVVASIFDIIVWTFYLISFIKQK